MRSKPELSEPRTPRGRLAWLAILAILAGLSLAQGFQNAHARSQDFQWSGVRMLFARIDPWAEYLRGDPLHLIHLSQIPNYLPVLYVLLVPIGFLPMKAGAMVWAVANVLFAILSAWFAGRFFGFGRALTFALACLLLTATPTRATLGNGQQGLLVLFLWCASLLAVRLSDSRAALAGISYFKFNFAPATAIYLLLRGGLRAILFSALPSAAATLLIWLWLTHGTNLRALVSVITGPLAVSKTGYFPSGGDPNLMDVLQVPLFPSFQPGTFLANRPVPGWVAGLTFAIAAVLCFAILYLATRQRDDRDAVGWHVALMAISSVVLFKHHPYDAVVLLIPFAYSLQHWKRAAGKLALLGIAYSWYFQKAVEFVLRHDPRTWKYLFFVEFAALAFALGAIYRIGATQAIRPLPHPAPEPVHTTLEHTTLERA